MPAARAQSRKAGLLYGASIPGRVQGGARVPRLSAILVVASRAESRRPNSPPSPRTRISGGRWRAGFRALWTSSAGGGFSRRCARPGIRSERSSPRSPRRPALRPMCASSAARTIRTPPSCPISCRGAIPSPSSRPAPGSSSWRSGEKAVSTRKPTCWPMSMCAAFRCRPRASWAGESLRSLLAKRRPMQDEADVAAMIASGVMALPAFSDQGGPFGARKGRIEGGAPATPPARTALATLYAALVTAHVLERLEAPGDLIVEGGFTRSPAFAAVLAAPLCPPAGRDCACRRGRCGRRGACLAHWGEPHPPPRLEPARAWILPGLECYRERWETRALVQETPWPRLKADASRVVVLFDKNRNRATVFSERNPSAPAERRARTGAAAV